MRVRVRGRARGRGRVKGRVRVRVRFRAYGRVRPRCMRGAWATRGCGGCRGCREGAEGAERARRVQRGRRECRGCRGCGGCGEGRRVQRARRVEGEEGAERACTAPCIKATPNTHELLRYAYLGGRARRVGCGGLQVGAVRGLSVVSRRGARRANPLGPDASVACAGGQRERPSQ